MSNLVVLDFDGIHTADEVLNKLRSLQKEYLIDLEDACVVEHEKGGKVHIKQAVNLEARCASASTGSSAQSTNSKRPIANWNGPQNVDFCGTR